MGEVSITRSVELEAMVDDVWEALTTPELLGGWLEGDVEVDVRPGGDGIMVEPDGAVRRMRIEEVDPARRLALQWWPEDGSGPASTVELDLHPMPGGTRLVVTETLLGGHPMRAMASAASTRWDLRLLLLGCGLLRPLLTCR
jgi:uncharacterized protein YndB with AHSA1/START domain